MAVVKSQGNEVYGGKEKNQMQIGTAVLERPMEKLVSKAFSGS